MIQHKAYKKAGPVQTSSTGGAAGAANAGAVPNTQEGERSVTCPHIPLLLGSVNEWHCTEPGNRMKV